MIIWILFPKGTKFLLPWLILKHCCEMNNTIGYIPVTNSLYLLNDKFVGQSSLN